MKTMDYEALILEEQDDNDGESGGGDGSDKIDGPRCVECGYVTKDNATGIAYRCNCR